MAVPVMEAYPDGAGNCEEPTHTSAVAGTLEDGGYEFTHTTSGSLLVPGETVTLTYASDFSGDSSFEIGGGDFMGFLVRISSTSGSAVPAGIFGSVDTTTTQGFPNLYGSCPAGVQGLNHVDNSEKTSLTFGLAPAEFLQETLSIKVVVVEDYDTWYSSTYTVFLQNECCVDSKSAGLLKVVKSLIL